MDKVYSRLVINAVTNMSFCIITVPDITLATVANSLEIEPLEANRVSSPARWRGIPRQITIDLQVFHSVQALISAALCSGLTDKESIGSLLPGRSLLTRQS